MDSMENAMVLYEEVIEMKKALDKAENELKEFLRDEMDRHGLASFKSKDKSIIITNVAPTAYVGIDTKRLKAEDFDTWEELKDKYPQYVEKKGYVKVTVK